MKADATQASPQIAAEPSISTSSEVSRLCATLEFVGSYATRL